MDSVLRKQFSGKGFRKTETNVFEIRREFWILSARRKGLGGNPRGLIFLASIKKENT